MIKVPSKIKRTLTQELKTFQVHIHALVARGKSATEEDARIIINDILSYALGYDKYNDLKTEFKDKNGRIDYVVKLTEGPNAKKKDKNDFIIEAKSTSIDLKEDHVNQTLSYCLTMGIDYFILTNVRDWRLYKVINSKTKKEANLIWESNLTTGKDIDTLADEMYIFSKFAYIENVWNDVSDISKATDIGELMAIIYSDKFVKMMCRTLKDLHEVRVTEPALQDILAKDIFKDFTKINKNLLKKLNTPEVRSSTRQSSGESKENVVTEEVVSENNELKDEVA